MKNGVVGNWTKNEEVVEGSGILRSRCIASWLNVGGNLITIEDGKDFENWLISLGVHPDEAKQCRLMGVEGKLELENSARKWLIR